MIRTFASKSTQRLFDRELVNRYPSSLVGTILKKLLVLDAADSLEDLRLPPGNRLEKLKGKRAGQHSIRINAQWRICFAWIDGDAYDVEIVDYH